MKNSIVKMMLSIAILIGAISYVAAPASASDGVLYGKSGEVYKSRKAYQKRKARYRAALHRHRHARRHHRSYRHRVVRRNHRARHIADVAVVKAAYIRRPGGRWKLVKARVRAAKVYARKRRHSH